MDAVVFDILTEDDWDQLEDLNARILALAGEWSGLGRGADALAAEFVRTLHDQWLTVDFNWTDWPEGEAWWASEDETKYDRLDIDTALRLMSALVRADRFNAGVLADAFASGSLPRIFDRFIQLGREHRA